MSFIDVKDLGIRAVSHSRMKTHEGCPRKAMYKFIDKLQEPGNDAMNRGLEVHKELENWLLCVNGKKYEGTGTAPRGKVYDVIRGDVSDYSRYRYEVNPEQQVAFDKEWNVCDWFGANAWMRVVFDLAATSPCKNHIFIGDYKTGKVYDDHDQQADLYAVAGYQMGAASVDVAFYYIDQNQVQRYTYDRDELEQLVSVVEARAAQVTEDRIFATNPSWRCKYCHFRKENGGPCVH